MTDIAATIPTWTLGDRLRKAREFACLEQGELASRVGVSRGTVSNYELGRGVRPPKLVVLRAWAQECNVPLEWLLEGPGIPFRGDPPTTDNGPDAGRVTRRYAPALAA